MYLKEKKKVNGSMSENARHRQPKAASTPNAISLDASEKERLLTRKKDC